MEQSVWLLEDRSRERINGKWSEWQSLVSYGNETAFTKYPENEVFSNPKYERRAVEYVRKES